MTISQPTERRTIRLVSLCGLALLVGAITGLGAIALRALIGLLHNVFFLGQLSWHYDANLPTPASPWGPAVILAPVVGGAIVLFLVRRFAPEAKGHGVPEVMDSIYYKEGRIRPVVVLIKSLASALSIGSGASVGREGPIIQIGSGIGSAIGQLSRLATWQTITLVAAGAGAGIAATFNTPLGAVMFAVELMLPELSARTFLPVVLATGTATYVGRQFFGVGPAFSAPLERLPDLVASVSIELLPLYVALGLICGLASALFVRTLYWTEDLFDGIKLNPYLLNAIGMLSIGVLMYVMFVAFGDYHTQGVGYSTIEDILHGNIGVAWMLALLFATKLVATSVSLGAGASGGIFSPSLFLGATLGGCFGAICQSLFPNLGLSPVLCAIIGMAGIVGGATGAAMTAILMIFEMTRDYAVTVPAIIAVACAIGLRRVLVFENIYTLKLARRGHRIPKDRHSHMFLIRHAAGIMARVVGSVELQALTPRAETGWSPTSGNAFLVVIDAQRVVGVIPAGQDGSYSPTAPILRDFTVVRDDDFLQAIMRRLTRKRRAVALVIKGGGVPRASKVLGVITRTEIANAMMADFTG
ncbi:MAG: chloride channel protein [Rhodospirillales bacterium]